jgi:ubiquinone/menaquinone biosynthesis C-methylase UbiE
MIIDPCFGVEAKVAVGNDPFNSGSGSPGGLSHSELRQVYQKNENVLRFCKEKFGSGTTNEQAAIMHAYELQAGSYIELMRNDDSYRTKKQLFGRALADAIAPYKPRTILEAGVGEATTLGEVLKNLPADQGKHVHAFDLSWSRVRLGLNYLKKFLKEVDQSFQVKSFDFFAGELEHIALNDNAFDVVFTSHAVEPNHGRERPILEELYRVTAGALILVEPGYEFASEESRSRMEYHGYCRGLADIARENGWKVARHELFAASANEANPSMILVIEKNAPVEESPHYISPVDGGKLILHNGHYFNETEGLVYPVIGEIPFLTRTSAVLATQYLNS